MELRTASQNVTLHALLSKLGISESIKKTLVASFTDNRTEHSSQMKRTECADLIFHLQSIKTAPNPTAKDERCDKMRKKILSRCHTMGWYVRTEGGQLVLKGGKPQLSWVRIDAFCVSKSPYKKRLQEHTYDELRVLVGIFDKVETHQLNKL